MKTYNIEFAEKDLNIVLFALQKQPFEMVTELMQLVMKQIQAQQSQEPIKSKKDVSKSD